MKALAQLKKLERLTLNSTRVGDQALEALKGHKTLKHLELADCKSLTANALPSVATLTSLESLNLAKNAWVRKAGLKSLKPLAKLKQLDLSNCSNVTTLGVGFVGDLAGLETLRLARCGTLTISGVRALQKLSKLKEVDLDGVRMSTTVYTNLRGSLQTARITGQPALYSTTYRQPSYNYTSAKVIVRGELNNAQKKALLEKLKDALEDLLADSSSGVTFYSVADVAEGTQFELAPVNGSNVKEFAEKITFGKTKLDAASRTITVELPKKPAGPAKKPRQETKPTNAAKPGNANAGKTNG